LVLPNVTLMTSLFLAWPQEIICTIYGRFLENLKNVTLSFIKQVLIFSYLGGIPRSHDLSRWIGDLEGQGWSHFTSSPTNKC
jgi:hypothetical protein